MKLTAGQEIRSFVNTHRRQLAMSGTGGADDGDDVDENGDNQRQKL